MYMILLIKHNYYIMKQQYYLKSLRRPSDNNFASSHIVAFHATPLLRFQ